MGSNHGNLLNELITLVWGRHIVLHVIMNSTGVGVGDEYKTVSGPGWSGCNDTGEEGVWGGVSHRRVEDTGRYGWGKGYSW